MVMVDKWQTVEIGGKSYDLNVWVEDGDEGVLGGVALYPVRVRKGVADTDLTKHVFYVRIEEGGE